MRECFGGKIVVIIGGNSGIGLASAKAFASDGAHVIITGRNPVRLQAAVEEIGCGARAYRSDISVKEEIDALFDAIRGYVGRIDVLFVNAGVLAALPIESVTEADWDFVQGINLKGMFFVVQRALTLMTTGSSIVLCSSTAAKKGIPNGSLYVVSKAGVVALGRCLAAELVDRGIRVNVVSPGPTETPIYDRVRGLSESQLASLHNRQIETVPMKRMAQPHEVAAAVLFLSGESAAFITGIDLAVNGGIEVC